MDIISTSLGESPNFTGVAHNALSYLREKTGFDLWMVTRVEGDDWIVLNAEDHSYGVSVPQVFRWTDSFCSKMVLGLGPRVAPCSDEIPAYANALIGKQVQIGAYIGVPLVNHDGTLFGTLCAIHPRPQPESVRAELPLVELVAGMLSGVLAAEIMGHQLTRQAERALVEAETDALTGLYNRRGWDRLLLIEEAQCQRYGHPSCVLVIDLDGLKVVNDTQGHAAGDELIVRAAKALKGAVRKVDLVARVGGDEFQILGVECDSVNAEAILERIEVALDRAGDSASIGISKRVPTVGLHDAVKEADRRMYAAKQRRKEQTAAPAPPANASTGEPARGIIRTQPVYFSALSVTEEG